MNQAIVYIITKLELGGAQKVCLSLFNKLQKNNHTFLITGREGPLVEQVKHLPNVFLVSTLQREVGLKGLLHEFRTLYRVTKILRTIKSKHLKVIVHTHSTKAGIIGRWCALLAGIQKRIHTIHGFAFHEHQSIFIWLPLYLAEWITSFITTHFVCVSSYDIQLGNKLLPGFKKKHSLIRAAIEQKQFYIPARKTNGQTPSTFIFGTVACFKPQKNIFDLLRAFEKIYQRNNKTRLEIIGDGVLRTEIEQWIIQHKLKQSIVLHGWQHQVAPIMLTWNAFVLTSLWEGLPCALVEARLLKLPVISYNTGGIVDIIHHEKNGLLVPQKNWHQFAFEMERLLHDTFLYQKLKNTSESLYEFKYDYMAEQHRQLYRQVK